MTRFFLHYIIVDEESCMGTIIQYRNSIKTKENKKGVKMYKEIVNEIRQKPVQTIDMPSRAQEVLSYYKIKDFSKGVPIVEILTKLGFKIFQSDLKPDGLSAYIAVNPKFVEVFDSNKITCVHVEDNIGHKRFSLAHELAHYLFDFNESENLCYYNTYFPKKEEDSMEEERANKFAANLLMPEKEFLKKYKEYKKVNGKADTVNELGRYFVVSPTAVLRRFTELNIAGYDN